MIPVDVADQADAHARELFEKMVAGDLLDGMLPGADTSVSGLAVALLAELRTLPGHCMDEDYEAILMNFLLVLAHGIRSASNKKREELFPGE